VTSLVFLGFFYQLVRVPAAIVLVIWFALQLLNGIGSLGVTQGGGVAFFAHIGGFVFGAVVAWLVNRLGTARPASRIGVG
jgi:membrane associated rhomboid family serine protease